MRNAGARRVKIDAVLPAERFYLGVFLEILRRDILNVVIDCENRLRRIGDGGGADLFELWNYCAGIVVRHHVTRANRNEISCAYDRARSKSVSVSCGNFLDERETHINSPDTRLSTINSQLSTV